MPMFVTPRDRAFFYGLNKELINEVINTTVIIYAIDKEFTESNLYGESSNKIFLPGIEVNALIERDDEATEEEDMGISNLYQNIRIAFHRDTMKEIDFYPERGDFMKWNNAYYEVGGIIDNQLIAGRPELAHSIVAAAHMVNVGVINIRNLGDNV
jgi:hypothetical protein